MSTLRFTFKHNMHNINKQSIFNTSLFNFHTLRKSTLSNNVSSKETSLLIKNNSLNRFSNFNKVNTQKLEILDSHETSKRDSKKQYAFYSEINHIKKFKFEKFANGANYFTAPLIIIAPYFLGSWLFLGSVKPGIVYIKYILAANCLGFGIIQGFYFTNTKKIFEKTHDIPTKPFKEPAFHMLSTFVCVSILVTTPMNMPLFFILYSRLLVDFLSMNFYIREKYEMDQDKKKAEMFNSVVSIYSTVFLVCHILMLFMFYLGWNEYKKTTNNSVVLQKIDDAMKVSEEEFLKNFDTIKSQIPEAILKKAEASMEIKYKELFSEAKK